MSDSFTEPSTAVVDSTTTAIVQFPVELESLETALDQYEQQSDSLCFDKALNAKTLQYVQSILPKIATSINSSCNPRFYYGRSYFAVLVRSASQNQVARIYRALEPTVELQMIHVNTWIIFKYAVQFPISPAASSLSTSIDPASATL